MASRPRIVIASPHVAECTSIADWLAPEGFEPVRVTLLERAMEEIRTRPFDLLIADVTFAFRHGLQAMGIARARNSGAPIIVVSDPDAASEAEALERGAMFLPRPVERAALVCTVSMAVMDSRPVRRSPRKRVNRVEAVVEGVPSHLIDVSHEGLRLEVPRARNSAPPPPFFNVRVPKVGVSLIVRRMWTSSSPEQAGAAWYGGELSRNPSKAELTWRRFVDTISGGGAMSSAALKLH